MVLILVFLLQLEHLRKKNKIPVYQLLLTDYKFYSLWCFHLTYTTRKVFVTALSNMNIIFKRLMKSLREVCPLEIPATNFVIDFLRYLISQPIQEISLFIISVLSGGTWLYKGINMRSRSQYYSVVAKNQVSFRISQCWWSMS